MFAGFGVGVGDGPGDPDGVGLGVGVGVGVGVALAFFDFGAGVGVDGGTFRRSTHENPLDSGHCRPLAACENGKTAFSFDDAGDCDGAGDGD